ncbi:MAG: hypothetical protein MMC33_003897 [Icmadophila ericetorum]|nr:hypothetical protein [Icmadophila ericetorum]
MVGKRDINFRSRKPHDQNQSSGDLENGLRPKPRVVGFKDVATLALDDKRRNELKTKLKEGIERGALEKYRKSDEELKAIKNKKIRAFYEEQNNRLNDWLEVDSLVMSLADSVLDSMNPDADHDGIRGEACNPMAYLPAADTFAILDRETALYRVGDSIEELLPFEEREKRRKANRNAKWAININVIANILLLIGKIVATTQSSSLSLIASTLDSALDLLCTVIVWTTNKLVQWRIKSLQRRFPVGRRRLEPLGILVFSIIMVISFLQILQESVKKLLPGGEREVTELPPLAIAALVATVVIKDCKTDVIFNTASLLFPFIGSAASIWWLDPVGAGLLSLFIIYDWGATCFENVTRLSGTAVDEDMEKKLTYLAWRFSPVVDGFKSLKAYHAGDGVWAEMDVLFQEDTLLSKAHDVAETLQYCCEGLSEVDRAFVSVDYTYQGPSGHTAV